MASEAPSGGPGGQPPEEGPPLDSPPPGYFYRIAWVFYLVLALAGVAWVGFREKTIPTSLFFNARTWPVDLACGVGGAAVMIGLWEAARRLLPQARRMEETLRRTIGSLGLDEVFAISLLSGFAEELFFRGAVQGSWGWIVATILFALLHTGPGKELRLWPYFAAVAGLLFGGLMIWRGNLLAPIVAHVVVNGTGLLRLTRAGEKVDP